MFIYYLSITIRSSLFCKGKQFCGNPQKKQKEFGCTRTLTNASRACREYSRQARLSAFSVLGATNEKTMNNVD